MVKKVILVQVALLVLVISCSLIMCTARPLNEQKWALARDLILEVLPKGRSPPSSDPSNCSHSQSGGSCPPP
ncbi:hypothetical protein FCM35_KLT02973 [Carex littledalei]|uniref:Uncharacterized protein n=1 Tax=Carex littledalei TaxID=544730 RepID=A0A833R3X1_9POAL|nr:hypothetical protein FCM35_KLT02973 [Carex littledalei]